MDNTHKIAKKVADAVEAIDVINGKIERVTEYAGILMETKFKHIEIALEELDLNNPPQVKPFAVQLAAEQPGKESLPTGYMKVYPFTECGNINLFSTSVPIDIALAVIDTLIKRMIKERDSYHKIINQSIGGETTGEVSK